MIVEHINCNTVRLTSDTKRRKPKPKPRGVVVGKPKRRPKKALNSLERLMVDSVKEALTKRLWLERQLRRSADYMAALEARGCSKSQGMPGWYCPPSTRVMVRAGQLGTFLPKRNKHSRTLTACS